VLRGELDWIVMRALEKDRDRRYESASAFAADVQRYLDDEAVAACPPSAGYRLRKYARRHRRALVTAGVISVALIAATAVSFWQAAQATKAQHQAEADRDRATTAEGMANVSLERARDAEQRATTEAAIARAVNAFLQEDLLGQVATAPPGWESGESRQLTVKEALDRAAARIGTRFQNQPLVEAAIRMAIGNGYFSLKVYQQAAPHFERALDLRERHLGPDHSDTRDSMSRLAAGYQWLGRHPESIALRQQLVKTSRAALGPDHPETRQCVVFLAQSYHADGQLERSARLLEQLLKQQRAIEGPTHRATQDAMQRLAWAYGQMDRLEESLALYEQFFALRNEGFGSDFALMLYVIVCQWAGKYD
jgi:tetratricopeptide (TPR) repeat protein